MEKELETALFSEDAPLLPDGWQEGDDLFGPETEGKPEDLLADELTDPGVLLGQEGQGTTNEAAPTTGGTTEETGLSDTDGDTGADTDGGQQGELSAEIYELKVNHKDKEVDWSALSREERVALLQKSFAFDAMKEAENKKLFREVYQEELDNGMSERAALRLAKDAVDGKTYSLEDGDETEPTQGEIETAPEPTESELDQLKLLFPDMVRNGLPKKVATDHAKGVPLLMAAMAYNNQRQSETVAVLKKENKILKQNAASAAKTPMTGVTGLGSTKGQSKPKDLFLEGFQSEYQ